MRFTPRPFFLVMTLFVFVSAACVFAAQPPAAPSSPTPTAVPATLTPSPTAEPATTETPAPEPTQTPEPTATSGPTPTLAPDAWKHLPVIPTALSEKVYKIYDLGKLMGNNPQAFSKVGDCHSVMPYFLGGIELYPDRIRLGEYGYLQATLAYYAGSFGRESLATKDGLSARASTAPLWNDWRVCEANEAPLACEYRLHKPIMAIISFGTNDAMGSMDFENSMRRVIENTIGNGVIPILSTKPDDAEGGHKFNQIIARLAYEYELPLWNFWAVVQPLPEHGMMSRDHLSYSEILPMVDFETPGSLDYGWTMRNLSALQLLDAMRTMLLEYEAGE